MNLFNFTLLLFVLIVSPSFSYSQANANFSGVSDGENVCSNAELINLVAVDPRGQYSGTGVLNVGTGFGTGTFNPLAAGAGSHSINYSIGKFFIDVESGERSSFAIANDGSLWSWGMPVVRSLGYAPVGQLNQTIPRRIGTSFAWNKLSVNYNHSLALKNDGTLWSWGTNNYGQTGTNTTLVSQVGTSNDWVEIAAGLDFSLAIKSDGTLWAWGKNSHGELGIGNNVDVSVPVQVGTDSDWQKVGAGGVMSFAIKTNGTLWSTGSNSNGQLGNGTTISSNVFAQVGIANNWSSISVGRFSALALKTNGTLWSWGDNALGSLALGFQGGIASVPTQIGSDLWSKAVITHYSALAIKQDGTLWSWGPNFAGELGFPNTSTPLVPTQVGTDSDWIDCSGGWSNSLAIKNDGHIWACGKASWGILGNGTEPVNDQETFIQSVTHGETTVNFNVINGPAVIDYQISCDSLVWKDGNTYHSNNSTATFRVANAALNGCDSLYTLSLVINNTVVHNQSITECNNTEINGNIYTSSQMITDTLFGQSFTGCDSIVITNLVIKDSSSSTFTTSSCKEFTWIDGMTYTTSNNTAQHTILNAAGCDSIISLDLTIDNVSSTSVTVDEPTLTSNADGALYQWFNCVGNIVIPISNETSQSFTPVSNGDYAVQITENGCIDTSICYSIYSASLPDLASKAFKLYPNPSNDGKFNFLFEDEIISIKVYNITGQQVDFDVNLKNKTIYSREHEGGTYYAIIVTNNEVLVKELVF